MNRMNFMIGYSEGERYQNFRIRDARTPRPKRFSGHFSRPDLQYWQMIVYFVHCEL